MAREPCGEYVGLMPVDDFLDKFIPFRTEGAELPEDLTDDNFFNGVPTKASETTKLTWDDALQPTHAQYHSQPTRSKRYMYQPIQERMQKILPKCPVVVSAHHSDKKFDGEKKWRPDLSVHITASLAGAGLDTAPTQSDEAPIQLDKADVLVEVKSNPVTILPRTRMPLFSPRGRRLKKFKVKSPYA